MSDQIDMFREAAAEIRLSREWAMPSADTFSIEPIRRFIRRHYQHGMVSVDPFARNSKSATHTNDLNPETAAEHHMDAGAFCAMLVGQGVKADLVFFDPPYSPRQISEVYQSIGRTATMTDTQSAVLYKGVRDALDPLVNPGGIVLSFGWNSAGMGRKRGYEMLEILLVAHGGAHNDTICMAERKAHV